MPNIVVTKALTKTASPAKIAGFLTEGYPSGQRGQTVNLLSYDFGGSNPPPSTSLCFAFIYMFGLASRSFGFCVAAKSQKVRE